MAALALLAAAITASVFSNTDASDALGLGDPLRPTLRSVAAVSSDETAPAEPEAQSGAAAAPNAGAPSDSSPLDSDAAPQEGSEQAPEPVATPSALLPSAPLSSALSPSALPRSGTPATGAAVDPPVLVQIPADLISTPTPLPDAAPSLPMLTNIPSVPRDGSVVYLTFDDGPDPVYTNQILDVLARYNARATFFVLGSSVDAYPGVVQRIAAEGHAVGNHTYRHEALPNVTTEQVSQTLGATNSALNRAIGRGSSCLRPPYGALDQATFDYITGLGYTVHMWEVDSEDWKTNDPYTIAATVLSTTSLGHRILFHDGPTNRASTVAALESVLEVLSNRGVTFQALNC